MRSAGRGLSSGISYGGGDSVPPYVFDVRTYGAVGDDSTDDTAGLIDAFDQAIAYADATAEAFAIVRGYGVTVAGSGTVKGGATLGNAQLPLPVRDPAARKITLVLQGPAPSDPFVHWNQATPARFPWTIRSTLTGQVSDGSHGAPSILGGPTPQHGYGSVGGGSALFNNLHLVLDNVGFMAPLDPSVIAVDLRGIAQASATKVGALANGTASEMSARQQSGYTTSYSSGFLWPQNLNNALLHLGSVSVEGFYTGTSITEHMAAARIACIYCHDGAYIQADGSGNHSPWVGNLCVEAGNVGIFTDGGASVPIGIHVGMFDTEGLTTHISDSTDALGGVVWWNDNNNSTLAPTVVGSRNLEIIATRRARGAVAAPDVPDTDVALKNPFYRHAKIRLTGGTVTVVAIDGVTTGDTTGWFDLPSGASITLTHSVAPTWTWWLQ